MLCRLISGNPFEGNGNTGSVRLNLPESGSRFPWIGHMVRAAGCDVAFVHGLARMGAVGQFSMWLRLTLGPRKRDGAWQITYEHESAPIRMDDFTAGTDLEP